WPNSAWRVSGTAACRFGWHALSLRRAWLPGTPFEDSGRATQRLNGTAFAFTLHGVTLFEQQFNMTQPRVGLWLIGAFGGVGSTATLGVSALARGLTDTTALTTALPMFQGADLDAFGSFVVGGHDIRKGSFGQAVRELHERSGVFDAAIMGGCLGDL